MKKLPIGLCFLCAVSLFGCSTTDPVPIDSSATDVSAEVSTKISYTMQNVLSEDVVDHAFARTVSLWKIETDSDKADEINAIIYAPMEEKRLDYLSGVPYEWFHLHIDTTWTECGDILCITSISDQPWNFVTPFLVGSVYYDLGADKLLTLEEFCAWQEIDLASMVTWLDTEQQKMILDMGYEDILYTIQGLYWWENEPILVVRWEYPDGSSYSKSYSISHPEAVVRGGDSLNGFTGFDGITIES